MRISQPFGFVFLPQRPLSLTLWQRFPSLAKSVTHSKTNIAQRTRQGSGNVARLARLTTAVEEATTTTATKKGSGSELDSGTDLPACLTVGYVILALFRLGHCANIYVSFTIVCMTLMADSSRRNNNNTERPAIQLRSCFRVSFALSKYETNAESDFAAYFLSLSPGEFPFLSS